MVTRLSAAPAAAAFVLIGIAIGSGVGASANQLVQCSETSPPGACDDNITIEGLTTQPTQDFGCPLPGGPLVPCTGSPPGRAPGHLPLAPHGLLVINIPRLSDPPRPEPPVGSITVMLGFVPRHHATGFNPGLRFKRIVVRGRAHPNRRHTLWTFRLPRHIAGNELDLVLDGAAVEAFGVTTKPGCA